MCFSSVSDLVVCDDANGNQQVTIDPALARTTTTWDFENKTKVIALPTGVRNTMAYDPTGLRVELQESAGTKKFEYDG